MTLKPCCDWETFEESLRYTIEKHKFPEILIDWKKAKRCWNRAMTGYEAFMTITKHEREQMRDYQNAVYVCKFKDEHDHQ